MNNKFFASILATYLLLLCLMGYLAFIEFPGRSTLPSPEMVKDLGKDETLKKDLLEDLKQARERNQKIVDLLAQSFNVILGATLGFLSAVSAGKLRNDGQTPHSPDMKESEDDSIAKNDKASVKPII